jgi:hypothetical protein
MSVQIQVGVQIQIVISQLNTGGLSTAKIPNGHIRGTQTGKNWIMDPNWTITGMMKCLLLPKDCSHGLLKHCNLELCQQQNFIKDQASKENPHDKSTSESISWAGTPVSATHSCSTVPSFKRWNSPSRVGQSAACLAAAWLPIGQHSLCPCIPSKPL